MYNHLIFPPENKCITVYLSHPIRGIDLEATQKDFVANNKKAINFAHELWVEFGDYLHLYVPAAHDEFVLEAYDRLSLTEDEILEIDEVILARRDAILYYNWQHSFSGGMTRECTAAVGLGKPGLETYGDVVYYDTRRVTMNDIALWLSRLWQKKYGAVLSPHNPFTHYLDQGEIDDLS